MQHSQEDYLTLTNEAHIGLLRLPAFQREWKWEAPKVVSLYDSLRKGFPIGTFLFIKVSKTVNLSPRPFSGQIEKGAEKEVRLTLDGQQRLTAGIALLHGIGKTRYFLNLDVLYKQASEAHLDVQDEKQVAAFVQDLDEGDGYFSSSSAQTQEDTLLLEKHQLNSRHLSSQAALRKHITKYEEEYPDRKDFCEYVIVPHFHLDNKHHSPVITLNEGESLAAVTKIFATVNTTGKRLTPVEIVTATLYSGSVDLRKKVQEFHDASDYLPYIDPTGEILLQTVVLLSGDTPKKALLPKTVTSERFNKHFPDALDLLDAVGEVLTNRLGVGLNLTDKLLPYDSILCPMAVVFAKVKRQTGVERERSLKKLDEWFIGSALTQRYQEGVHNKQERDAREFAAYLDDNKSKPSWLESAYIPPEFKSSGPDGAHGRLFRCLINKERPVDPRSGVPVGYYVGADAIPENHHIWPTKYCEDHLSEWNNQKHTANVALNIAPVTTATNGKWLKMNPSDQIRDIENQFPAGHSRDKLYDTYMLSTKCVDILKKKDKTVDDLTKFIDERYADICKRLGNWGFKALSGPGN